MQIARREIDRDIKTPLLGMGVVVLSLVCFLIIIEAVFVLVRFLVG